MLNAIKLFFGFLFWIPMIVVRVVGALLGALVIPFCLVFKLLDLKRSPYVDKDVWALPAIFQWWWGNWEDGMYGPDIGTSSSLVKWLKKMEGKPRWWRCVSWSVLRNSCSNGRYWWPKLDRMKIESVFFHRGPRIIEVARQGIRVGVNVFNLDTGWDTWVGFKINYSYTREIDRYQGFKYVRRKVNLIDVVPHQLIIEETDR